MPSNRAAWLNAQNERLTVAEAPLSDPEENQILIKTVSSRTSLVLETN